MKLTDELKPLPDNDLQLDRNLSIRANPETQSLQDLELWQDLKPDATDSPKRRYRKRSAQIDTNIGSQLGFWDLTGEIIA